MASLEKRSIFKRRIESLLADASGENLKQASSAMVQAKLTLLNQYWDQFLEAHMECAATAKDADATVIQDKLLDEVESNYLTAQSLLKERMAAFEGAGSLDQSATGKLVLPNIQELTLEKIKLGTFSGQYHQWRQFRDTFTSMVHEKRVYSDVQKLHYLVSSLTGEAAQVVKGFQITDANYLVAWEALTARYDNNRLIVNSLLTELFEMKQLARESNSGLRKIVDTVNEVVRQLRMLEIQVDAWDAILVYIVTQRLDHNTRRAWELTQMTNELPKLSELLVFVECRARSLDSLSSSQPMPSTSRQVQKSGASTSVRAHAALSSPCPMCSGGHELPKCPLFLALSVHERYVRAKQFHLCFNCLKEGHPVRECPGGVCRKCNDPRRHHTLLCPKIVESSAVSEPKQVAVGMIRQPEPIVSEPGDSVDSVNASIGRCPVLLGTAVVLVTAHDGTKQRVRALCDVGAQNSILTEDCTQRLRLQRRAVNLKISGVGDAGVLPVSGVTTVEIAPRFDSKFSLAVQCIIMKKITAILPSQSVPLNWPQLEGLTLADPDFGQPGKIDLLLGADVWGNIILDGIRRGLPGTPAATQTQFGWIVFGPTQTTPFTSAVLTVNLSVQCSLESALRQFWESEELEVKRICSPEEELCEEIFTRTTKRDSEGRYVVEIPFKPNAPKLGSSRASAARQFHQLERRLQKNPDVYAEYRKSMSESLVLNHMRLAESILDKDVNSESYNIPHHEVVSASKFRVVFNASCKTSSGVSLNDIQLTGPRLQDDLYNIMLRFRTHRIALVADITKMYRQVRVAEHQLDYQRIFWRRDESEPLEEYQLTTVTYGMTSAPFCAVRALRQCAEDGSEQFPIAAKVALRDFYVDDLITGTESEDTATELYHEVSELLASGGFILRKWVSNSFSVQNAVRDADADTRTEIPIGEQEIKSVLGLLWFPVHDTFGFQISEMDEEAVVTKRSILSEVSRLYDPNGYLSPVIVRAKILIQELWMLGLDWDIPVPENLVNQWSEIRSTLHVLSEIRIPRWIGTSRYSELQLHGFCDASSRAYGAVVYARVVPENGETTCILVTAKSKVAPVKTMSIPRLELCAAHLLAKLMEAVKSSLVQPVSAQFCWSDSTIVLHWIHKLPCTLKVFAANRVAEIIRVTAPSDWNHVPTECNPADSVSRGVFPTQLVNHRVWWNGPSWLKEDSKEWPKDNPKWSQEDSASAQTELKEVIISVSVLVDLEIRGVNLLDRYSSLNKLVRVTSQVRRWAHNWRAAKPGAVEIRRSGPLEPEELRESMWIWVKQEQEAVYFQEIKCCRDGVNLPKSSPLVSLTPYLDSVGVLRVGGRLKHAPLSEEVKHPAILPPESKLTTLILRRSHQATVHGGVQLMLQNLRTRYWIVGARRVVKKFIHQCLPCFRQKRKTAQQLMGDLPMQRTAPCRAFYRSGVDYCGPMSAYIVRGRGRTTIKCYVAVFVCFATKAIHLEMVSDLTTDAFLAAFRRFTGRRGACSELWSDNGTMFVGARRVIDDIHQIWQDSDLRDKLVNEGTKWVFIPPSAPHQGGLWEAGVKSAKHHLTRVIGANILTVEEFQTLLVQVEACLNSRPLTALSDDPEDLSALTPGHFLIGEPIITLPEPGLLDVPLNRLNRWQFVQRLQQDFWKRWSREYVSQLVQRPKWREYQENVKVGDLVLIKADNLPPTRWQLGRIVQVHPGSDTLVRSATVKTSGGEIRRPIQKLCVLPLEADEVEQPQPTWSDIVNEFDE